MGLDLILPRRREKGDESLADFVTRRLGREALTLPSLVEASMGAIRRNEPGGKLPLFLRMEQKTESDPGHAGGPEGGENIRLGRQGVRSLILCLFKRGWDS